MFVYQCVCISVCLYISVFVYKCVCISVCFYISVFVYQCVCISVCLYISVFVYQCVCISVCFYISVFVYQCVCIPVCLYISVFVGECTVKDVGWRTSDRVGIIVRKEGIGRLWKVLVCAPSCSNGPSLIRRLINISNVSIFQNKNISSLQGLVEIFFEK